MGAAQSSGSTSQRPEWHRFSSHNSNTHRAWLQTTAVTSTPWDSFACLERPFLHIPSGTAQGGEGRSRKGSDHSHWQMLQAPGHRPAWAATARKGGGVFGSLPAVSSRGDLGTCPPQTQPRQLCQPYRRSLSNTVLGIPQICRADSPGLPLSTPSFPKHRDPSAALGSALWGTKIPIPA